METITLTVEEKLKFQQFVKHGEFNDLKEVLEFKLEDKIPEVENIWEQRHQQAEKFCILELEKWDKDEYRGWVPFLKSQLEIFCRRRPGSRRDLRETETFIKWYKGAFYLAFDKICKRHRYKDQFGGNATIELKPQYHTESVRCQIKMLLGSLDFWFYFPNNLKEKQSWVIIKLNNPAMLNKDYLIFDGVCTWEKLAEKWGKIYDYAEYMQKKAFKEAIKDIDNIRKQYNLKENLWLMKCVAADMRRMTEPEASALVETYQKRTAQIPQEKIIYKVLDEWEKDRTSLETFIPLAERFKEALVEWNAKIKQKEKAYAKMS